MKANELMLGDWVFGLTVVKRDIHVCLLYIKMLYSLMSVRNVLCCTKLSQFHGLKRF